MPKPADYEEVTIRSIMPMVYIDVDLCRLRDPATGELEKESRLMLTTEAGGNIIYQAIDVTDAHRLAQDLLAALASMGSRFAIEATAIIDHVMEEELGDFEDEDADEGYPAED